MTLLLGIDVSTTGSKALVIDERGQVVASATTPHPISTPRPLWSEQAPADWWQSTITSIRRVLEPEEVSRGAVGAVGLTGQMHGLTLLDESGAVLRPAMLWNDQRTGAECDEIRERVGRRRLIELTGNDALTGFTAPKMLWVRRHEPQVWGRARHALLPKDYVRYRLSGRYATDRAGAAGTLLVDVRRRDWSPEVLAALDIDPQLLPPTHEGTAITGEISPRAAEETGLAAGTPVVAGGGDQAAQAVGVGAVGTGVVALTLGTSGVVFASVTEPFIEPEGRLHSFCHAVPGTWHLMGVMLSAAGSLRWYRDTVAPEHDYDALTAEAAAVPAGSEGLHFAPYLTGERTPHPDPHARGAFVGLSVRHGRGHLTRAVLEGVAFGLRDVLELMRSVGLGTTEAIRISGGGARSALWRQILASVLEEELVSVASNEGAAHGAALLAGLGIGVWPDVAAACRDGVALRERTAPEAALVERYREPYAIHRTLYPTLRETWARQGRSAEAGGATE